MVATMLQPRACASSGVALQMPGKGKVLDVAMGAERTAVRVGRTGSGNGGGAQLQRRKSDGEAHVVKRGDGVDGSFMGEGFGRPRCWSHYGAGLDLSRGFTMARAVASVGEVVNVGAGAGEGLEDGVLLVDQVGFCGDGLEGSGAASVEGEGDGGSDSSMGRETDAVVVAEVDLAGNA